MSLTYLSSISIPRSPITSFIKSASMSTYGSGSLTASLAAATVPSGLASAVGSGFIERARAS
jgi:hypothetical protein